MPRKDRKKKCINFFNFEIYTKINFRIIYGINFSFKNPTSMVQNETERQRKKLKNDKIIPKDNEKKKPDDAQKYLSI